MNAFRLLLCSFAALALGASANAAEPLRVFIRAGVKTHGPGQHDHPQFLKDWVPLLKERGLKADGAMTFPTADQLAQTDVLIIFAADGMKITGEERESFEKFLRRGGGFVVLHDGVVSADQHEWCKQIIGGAWIWPKNAPEKKPTRWLESYVGLYFVDNEHPITRGISNFDWKDEIYYDLDMSPDVHVLASSFHDVHTIAPQLWIYEKTLEGGSKPYRAFVSIPGHEYASFGTPHYRAILMRGIAWAGGRANVDEFCSKEELASLMYPPGGPTPASKAVKNFTLHPEFNISLCADENVAEKIMSLDWDPRGRLWVAETPEYPGGRTVNRNDLNAYPNRRQDPEKFPIGGKEPRPAHDRVSILEDTDGDGVMDKRTVFYEGLERVTSLVFYKDGVIVAQAPDFLWLRDTDGDGKADKVETILTGWGIGDTHAVTSNLRWGPDGWIYGSVGYSRGKVRSPKTGKDFGDISAGIYRFRPDGSALEQIASEGCNTWGCEVAPDGEIFFTTATCGEPICHVALPEKFLARGNVGGHRSYASIIEENKIFPPFKETRQVYVQIDWVNAWTAAAGACIYDGGAWPAKWSPEQRYSFFMSEATMHLFHHEFLDPAGSTYQGHKEDSRRETHFLMSTDYWFRPIHSRVGPDGAMYVVDFYNQIAVHNDTRGPKVGHGAHNAATRPDRDHHFTRVYRVQHKEAVKLPAFKLDPNDPAALAAMLEHPNGWVRTTANRLLNESQQASVAPALATILKTSDSKYGRIQALYALNNLDKLDEPLLLAALQDKDSAVRKNAARIVAERDNAPADVQKAIRAMLNEQDGRARVDAAMALGSFPPSRDIAEALVAAWPSASGDKFFQSALIGSAARGAAESVAVALAKGSVQSHGDFVRHLIRSVALKGDGAVVSRVVQQLAGAPASADALRATALESLAASYKGEAPEWTVEFQSSLKSLLNSEGPATASAVIPLIGRWDKSGAMAGELKPLLASLAAKLSDMKLSDEARAQAAANLLGVRAMDANIVPAVAKLLVPENSPALQRQVAEALGNISDAAAGAELVGAYAKLSGPGQEAAFGQILKRADWATTFVNAVKAGAIDWRALGPGSAFRLRTHADKSVAKFASQVFDELRGPEAKEKETLITQFSLEAEKPGDLANGKKLFDANCAGCHKFKDAGRDLAPDLTGMGVHGAHELLVHVLDPNRVVEENFVAISIETKDGEAYDGVVSGENRDSLKLRNASGDIEIQKRNIASRRSTGRSLMPEGFEALGPEGLRDLLGYIASEEGRYRIIDLRPAFTADSTKGIYATRESIREGLHFKKFGVVKVGDVPFDIVNPAKSANGNNLVVLKGRNGITREFPQRVEVPVANLKASRLHILGNVAGWGYPGGGEDTPVARFTLTHADGETESFTLTNGIHVVDYINPSLDCPGSKKVDGVVTDHQIRLLTRSVKGKAPITKLSIESFNNTVASTFAAITAELGEVGTVTDVPVTAAVRRREEASGDSARVLTGAATGKLAGKFSKDDGVIGVAITGGDSAHDFARWWGGADVALLNAMPGVKAAYTENPDDLLDAFDAMDVFYLAHNQAMPNRKVREGLFAYISRGGGLLVSHAGNWLNWKDWPEYNRELVGGITRGHDKYGEFEVIVVDTSHPVMQGVPAQFKIKDELYNFIPDPAGSARHVLATAKSPVSGKEYPVVWVVKHDKARILCNTLGHDGQAHELPAYQTMLQNSVRWLAGGK
jgi:putative membrane-bound dehydrogenase-like protein